MQNFCHRRIPTYHGDIPSGGDNSKIEAANSISHSSPLGILRSVHAASHGSIRAILSRSERTYSQGQGRGRG